MLVLSCSSLALIIRNQRGIENIFEIFESDCFGASDRTEAYNLLDQHYSSKNDSVLN